MTTYRLQTVGYPQTSQAQLHQSCDADQVCHADNSLHPISTSIPLVARDDTNITTVSGGPGQNEGPRHRYRRKLHHHCSHHRLNRHPQANFNLARLSASSSIYTDQHDDQQGLKTTQEMK